MTPLPRRKQPHACQNFPLLVSADPHEYSALDDRQTVQKLEEYSAWATTNVCDGE